MKNFLSKWEPTDIMVGMLTLTICLSFISIVSLQWFRQEPMPPESTTLLAHASDAIIAIISVFVGSKFNVLNKRSDKQE